MPNVRYRQREKTLRVRCPLCTAPMEVLYDGTGTSGWDRATDLDTTCPKGCELNATLVKGLHQMLDQRAVDGVGDHDPRDVCGYDEDRR